MHSPQNTRVRAASSPSLPPLPPLIPNNSNKAHTSKADALREINDQPLNLTTKNNKNVKHNERPFDILSITKTGKTICFFY